MRLLTLGCHGREKDEVQLCGGTSSGLLDVDLVPVGDHQFHDFIFKLMQLDKQPAVDHNKVLNIIRFVISSGYLHTETANTLTEYITLHKKCGLYVYLRS